MNRRDTIYLLIYLLPHPMAPCLMCLVGKWERGERGP